MTSFTDDVKALFAQADKDRADLAAANQIIVAKDAIIAKKDQTIAEKDAIITNLNSTIAELNTTIAALNAEIARLQAIIDDGESSSNEELEAEIARLEAEVARLNALNASLNAEIASLNSEIAALQAEVARLQAIIDDGPTDPTDPTDPDPPPVHDIDYDNAFTIHDTKSRPNEQFILFSVTLDRPADRTLTVQYSTKNGKNTYNTVWEPATSGEGHYVGNAGLVVFQKGDKAKDIIVRLLDRTLDANQSVIVELFDYDGWPNHKYKKKSAEAYGDPSGALPRPAIAPTNAKLPAKPNMSRFFDDNLLVSFLANDTGLRANGTKCWRSRLVHGRTQPGNNELGYYTDPALVPTSNPFPTGPDGRRQVRAESFPNGVIDKNGNVIKIDYGDRHGQPFKFTAAILHSHTLLQVGIGDYVEARLKMEGKKGTWPAFWLLRDDYVWPPEIDILENFLKMDKEVNTGLLTSTVHWTDGEAHMMVPMPLHLPTILGKTFSWAEYHTYGCHLTDQDLIFYVDDLPVASCPTVIDTSKSFSILLNVAVGGLVGEPPVSNLPASMSIEYVRAYR